MDKKQLQTLIESNVRTILAEEKRKILLEKKINKLLSERKELSKKAFLLENNYKINQKKIASLNEAIKINENFLSKIGRAFKGFFGGLSPEDLEKMSREKKGEVVSKEEQYREKKLKIIYDLIDKLEAKIRDKFAPHIERIPTVKEIQDFSKETTNLYTTLIDFFPELRGKTVTDLLRTDLSDEEKKAYDDIDPSSKESSSIPGKFLTDMGKLKRSVLSIVRSVQDALEGHKAKLEAKQGQTEEDYSEVIKELKRRNKFLEDLLKINGEALLSGKLPVEPIGYGTPGWAKAAAAYRRAPRKSQTPQKSVSGPTAGGPEMEPSATAVASPAVQKAEQALEQVVQNVAKVAATVMQAAPPEDKREIVKVIKAIPIKDKVQIKMQTLPPPKKIGYEQEIKDAQENLRKLAGSRGNIKGQITRLESDLETAKERVKEPEINPETKEKLNASILVNGLKLLNLEEKNKEVEETIERLSTLLRRLQESVRRKNKKIV